METPVLSGTTLYGMTSTGGGRNKGTIFKVETNGGGYTLLHEFVGGADDGETPYYGSLVISGTTLYGMTYKGGDSDIGHDIQDTRPTAAVFPCCTNLLAAPSMGEIHMAP